MIINRLFTFPSAGKKKKKKRRENRQLKHENVRKGIRKREKKGKRRDFTPDSCGLDTAFDKRREKRVRSNFCPLKTTFNGRGEQGRKGKKEKEGTPYESVLPSGA